MNNSYVKPDLEQIRADIEKRGFAGWECVLLGMIDDLMKREADAKPQ